MKPSPSFSRRRRGFTLLELLVVVGIIAVLAAMLFPAIQRLREVANRTKCVNNLHQIGMAMTGHFGTHKCYPTNGWVIPSTGLVSPGVYYQYALASFPGAPPGNGYMWGMGDPTQGPKTQFGSWAFALLAYMEETNAMGPNNLAYGANGNYSNVVSIFLCPSRSRQTLSLSTIDSVFPPWTYNASWSPTPGAQANTSLLLPPNFAWAKTDYAGNYLMMPDATDLRFSTPVGLRGFGGARNYPVTPEEIKDGTSNTIVVGEKAVPVAAYNTGGWYWDEPFFTGGSGGTTRGVPSLGPYPMVTNGDPAIPFYSATSSQGFPTTGVVAFNYPSGLFVDSTDLTKFPGFFANNWGSPHLGGVNFLFADGSVRTFNYNVDPVLFNGLLTPAGVNGPDATPPES
jgi:prepilin-type N-terminal cleavage/methylation domain-containing protein/prepilin-type processing-associated H-X9-DG protein